MYFLLYLLSLPVLFVFAVYVCYFYFITSCKVSQWEKSNTPFVRPTFLIGHKAFLNVGKKCLPHILDQIYSENTDKDLVAFFATGMPFILLRDPNLIKKVIVKSSGKSFSNGFYPLSTDIEFQSTSFTASDKATWKIGRRVLERYLTPSRMGGPNFSKFKTQIDKLWHYCEEARAKGRTISLNNFAFNFIADCMATWNFSEETNSYERQERLHEAVWGFYAYTYTRTVAMLCQVLFPALQVFKFCKYLPQKHIDFMRDFLDQKIQFRDKIKTKHNDFIDYLMTLRSRDENADVCKKEISARRRTGYALAVLLGGSDTVAQVCLSAAHMLSLHPEHQERIRKEIDDAMNKHNVYEFTFEVIQDLQFTKQCVYESTRLIPLFKFNLRVISEDFQIPGTNYAFRRGDRVILTPYSVHRDSKYFSNPDKFDPERFSPENKTRILEGSFLSFGYGPRKCPGYKLGVLQAVLFVASIIFKYEMKPRSHLQQMTAADFKSQAVINLPREELLIDLIPRCVSTQ